MVLTPLGAVAVETLVPGTLLLAVAAGSTPFQPVVAIRRNDYAGPLVRIRAGAIEDQAPLQDLLLPATQALLIDDRLVPAGSLVDGAGIRAEPAGATLTLHEPVLADHGAMLASGLAVETGLPDPGAPSCAPRTEAGGPLRAALAWRAEAMGWSDPPPVPLAAPMLPVPWRELLLSEPLVPALPPPSPLPEED